MWRAQKLVSVKEICGGIRSNIFMGFEPVTRRKLWVLGPKNNEENKGL
jgi:hypothetical protein